MGWYKENDCVGCETCVSCGRNQDYYVAECDFCFQEGDENTPILEFGYEMLCPECVAKKLVKDGEVKKLQDGSYIWDENFYEDDFEYKEAIIEKYDVAKYETYESEE